MTCSCCTFFTAVFLDAIFFYSKLAYAHRLDIALVFFSLENIRNMRRIFFLLCSYLSIKHFMFAIHRNLLSSGETGDGEPNKYTWRIFYITSLIFAQVVMITDFFSLSLHHIESNRNIANYSQTVHRIVRIFFLLHLKCFHVLSKLTLYLFHWRYCCEYLPVYSLRKWRI